MNIRAIAGVTQLLAVVLATIAATPPQPAVYDTWPRFSPDGRTIAFVSSRGGGRQIFAVDADGSNVRRISPDLPSPASYGGASWRRDGTLLASVYFPTLSDGSDNGLAMVAYDSFKAGDSKRQTLFAGINAERPDSSPVDDAIVYEQEHGPFQSNPPIDVVVFNPATLKAQALTHGDGEYIQAFWSPNGSQIAFACAKPPQPLQICTMSADGSNVRAITSGSGSHQWPAWSPDGKHLAFFVEGKVDGKIDASIGTVDANGSNERLITAHSGARRDETPSWSPDGKTIAFQTDRGGAGFRIAVMNPDGSNIRMLTQ